MSDLRTKGFGSYGLERAPRRSPGLWFGLFAAPLAWAAQLVAGSQLEELGCSPAPGDTTALGIENRAAVLILTLAALAVAVAAGLASWRALRRSAPDESRFGEATVWIAGCGLALSVLFAALIVLGGIDVLFLDACEPG
jgi:hypothetical protein